MPISKRVPLEMLRPGVTLSSPIVHPNSPRVKLLGAGVVLTEGFIEALRKRGVDSLIVSEADIALLTAFTSQGRRRKVPAAPHYARSSEINEYSEYFDKQLKANPSPQIQTAEQPFAADIDTPADCGYADGLQYEWAVQNNQHVDVVSRFLEETVNDGDCDIGPLHQATCRIVRQIAEDKDALVCLSSTPHESAYPSRHGLHVAGVAMTIGVELGLDRQGLIDLGIGCMIHDVGMQAVGLRIFQNNKPLSSLQVNRLADHPVRALKLACNQGDHISELSKFVAYQIHERNDGSGYPRGWTGDRIHPLAKIAGVADAYVGMLTNRKHRLAIQGYHVMAHLLADMKAGKFDSRVIRALLNACSLYPLGSLVKLNNECVGRVIRSGRERFVEPTIEMWPSDAPDQTPAIVNLRHESKIRITGSMSSDAMLPRRAA